MSKTTTKLEEIRKQLFPNIDIQVASKDQDKTDKMMKAVAELLTLCERYEKAIQEAQQKVLASTDITEKCATDTWNNAIEAAANLANVGTATVVGSVALSDEIRTLKEQTK